MLHPEHLRPSRNVDPNKLAWLAWWQERRSDLVNYRNHYIIAGLGAAFGFIMHYVFGPRWGAFVIGCVFWVIGIYFYYHRRTSTAVKDWDEIGQLPYLEQCTAAKQKLEATGKPVWINPWNLIAIPIIWVLKDVVYLEWVWTEAMTKDLYAGLFLGISGNFLFQGFFRRKWQQGMDIINEALST